MAPLYPPQWLQKRMMTSVMRYQEYSVDMVGNHDQDKEREEDSNDGFMHRPVMVNSTTTQNNRMVSETQGGNDDDDDDDENKKLEIDKEINHEMHTMACNLHMNLTSQKKGESHQTWWQRATEGILVWQSSRKMCLILES